MLYASVPGRTEGAVPLHAQWTDPLAALLPDELAKFMASGPWEPLTPKTVTEPKVLLKRLRKVKSQGYAANESEYIAGVVGAAVPIQNTDGQVVAALTISAPKSRRTLEDVVAMAFQ